MPGWVLTPPDWSNINYTITSTGTSPVTWVGEKKEEHMSTTVTTLDQLRLAKGEQIIVRQDGTADTETWTADGEGGFTNGEATLTMRAFDSAISNGNIFLPGRHHLGQTLTDEVFYYRVIDRVDGHWVFAKTDSTGKARHSSIVEHDLIGLSETTADRDPEGAFAMLARVREGEVAAERLAKVLETGQIPDDIAYMVSVEVKGNVGIQPTEAQARRLVGDNKVQILSVNSTDVAYTKTVTVTKNSRWGCACAQVVAEDLGGVPGEMTSWSVIDCAPVKTVKGAEPEGVTAA